jgi:hypothetical protein
MERGMSNRDAGKLPLIEKVLAGSCLVTVGVYALSESAFTLSILSVTLLALVALFKETLS